MRNLRIRFWDLGFGDWDQKPLLNLIDLIENCLQIGRGFETKASISQSVEAKGN